ncbi:MAG: hypothetical protein KDD90_11640, partial [Sphingomonadaceae bacterium]|nr:hypothetical protein [Sphingomonadaceae bacterium]
AAHQPGQTCNTIRADALALIEKVVVCLGPLGTSRRDAQSGGGSPYTLPLSVQACRINSVWRLSSNACLLSGGFSQA